MTLKSGEVLNNRYKIVEVLGQGGMGAIYRAIDENLGIEVAVKENLFTTEEFARQFHREAIILASLRHPNLPRVTDHFVIAGQGQYLIMDYIEGENLSERIDRSGPLKEAEVVVLGVALCEALIYLHTRQPQVVHRDIKPGNVKITPSGSICLVDFGLAKVVEGKQITTTGARAMTPGYSPPEQYGTARTDHRTDIYSLGATLYVALTGVIPEDALERVMGQSKLSSIRKFNNQVPRRMVSVIEKAMALNPDDRYQAVEHFKEALINSLVTDAGLPLEDLVLSPPPVESVREGVRGEQIEQHRNLTHDEVEDQIPERQLLSRVNARNSESKPLFMYNMKRRRWGLFGTVLIVILVMFIAATWVNSARPGMVSGALDRIAPLLGSRENDSLAAGMFVETATVTITDIFPATSTPTPTQTPEGEGILTDEQAAQTLLVTIPEPTSTS
ncbi:MAG: serine/threonine protein kinase, partial [Anaerolineales bacterium]|nr:serine/threonine protein kinase [Anaerolineales bacterium]